MDQNKLKIISITAVISVVLTILLGALAISHRGMQRMTHDISPLVGRVENRITKGVVPESERVDTPKTEADILMEAVGKNRAFSVTIYTGKIVDATERGLDDKFVARGVVYDKEGWILTDGSVIKDDGEYSIVIPGKKDAFIVKEIKRDGVLVSLKIENDFSMAPTFVNNFNKEDQLVATISGGLIEEVHSGVVVLSRDDLLEDVIETTIIAGIVPGAPLVSSKGDVIGIALGEKVGENGAQLFQTIREVE